MAIAAPFPAAHGTVRVRQVPAARSPRTTRSTARLTSRGRALLMLGSALFLLLAVLVSGRFTAEAGSAGRGAPATSVVVVQAGENLWQLARELAPSADPREVVTQIRALNGLGSAPVEAGQAIVVPAFDTP
jgi:hypothetical protein